MRTPVRLLVLALPALAACASARNGDSSQTEGSGSAAQPTSVGDVTPPSASAAAAVETITEADVKRRIGIIAHDSMMGRDTPSPGLEKTAAYVANEFRRLGLKPAGDSGSFLQRYPLTQGATDVERSNLTLSAGSASATVSLARDAYFVTGIRPNREVTGDVMLFGGELTPAGVSGVDVTGKTVLLVADYTGSSSLRQVYRALAARRPSAVLIVSNREATAFDRSVAGQARPAVSLGNDRSGGSAPVIEVHERAIAPVLTAAGVDLAALRSSAKPVMRELPALAARATIMEREGSRLTAPNTVGILEGSDPTLKNEYIVMSAHMDHVGVGRAMAGDSIFNGADDDASGTAGIVELAEAFSQPGARPKRSIIFLTVSGEEKGLWGSDWFAGHPPVPIGNIVANLNLDMIGRNWADTIVVIGKEHSDLGATMNRVNAAHPELRMNAIDDRWPEERFYFRSDHYNFARRGVPILFFFNGVHEDYHRQGDHVEKIDAEKESRILKLVYFLGQEVGNASARPKWNPESYRLIVQPVQ